ncbi:MAG: hypothetical protein PHF24_05415 [Syntrophomonas sp.]|nr:hypothetical protein [Syntrophomonas sp.]
MRTLVATVLYNSKGKEIFCTAKKINDQHLDYIRDANRQDLEAVGFVFIKMLSLEYPNVRGYAIFFEGHVNDIMPALKAMAYK